MTRMDNNILCSLRLGFSSKQANKLKESGIEKFLKMSFDYKSNLTEPSFLKDTPKSLAELKDYREKFKKANKETEQLVKNLAQIGFDLHWQSDYYALGYDAPTQQFYVQNKDIMKAYPLADFFINGKITCGFSVLGN